MKRVTQVVLVDPNEETRQGLQRVLDGLSSAVWLADICTSLPDAPRSIVESRPQLAIVTVDSAPDAALATIQEIARVRPETVILPASKAHDPKLILRLVDMGFRKILELPTDLNELTKAIEALVAPSSGEADTSGRPQTIAVTGASGGIGSTTLAVNLATTLAQNPGQSVVLADFDLFLGTADTCLDIIPEFTMLDVVRDLGRIDLPLLKRSLTVHQSGLSVLPHPALIEDAGKIDSEDLKRVLLLLKSAFNTVVIDTSKGLQAFDFVAFEMADEILMVIQLELNCVRNSARLLSLFRQYENGCWADKIRVVVNRAGSTASEIGLRSAEQILGVELPWQIPNDTKLFNTAQTRGVPIDMIGSGSRAHKAIVDIAGRYKIQAVDEVDAKRGRRGGFRAAFFM